MKRLDLFSAIAFHHVITTITRDEGEGMFRFGDPAMIADIAIKYALAMEHAYAKNAAPPTPPQDGVAQPIPIKKGLN